MRTHKTKKEIKVLRKVLFIILTTILVGNVRAQVTSDSLVMNYLKDMGIPLTYNNKVELLMTGRDKFIDLFETIRHARHHIHLESVSYTHLTLPTKLEV